MSKNVERHRNKCQMCYSETGRLIMDCMCILCEGCFTKRNRQFDACIICQKKTKHVYIDTKDQKHNSKVSFLFHNIGINLSQCIEAYNFQISLDAKYCKFLEKQLMRHKEAISQLKQQNPHLEAYFINKLSSKPKTNVKYSSQYMPNHAPSYHQNYQQRINHQNNLNTSRSLSNQGAHLQHQMSIEGQRVKGHYQERNYSGKVNYKLPNMNYNTALRSSHRTMKDQQNSYYRR